MILKNGKGILWRGGNNGEKTLGIKVSNKVRRWNLKKSILWKTIVYYFYVCNSSM